MHILFVGFVWPEPTSSAAGQNIISYMSSCLSKQFRVSFCSAADPTERTHDLANMGIHTFSVKLNCSSFNQQIIDLKPDIVIFDRFLSFEQFAWRVKETYPQAMLVLDAEDLHCLREARHKLVKQQTKVESPHLFMQSEDILEHNNLPLLYNDITVRELACIYQADLTLVLSSFEQELLVSHFKVPANQVSDVPFILPHCDIIPIPDDKAFEQKQDFVFIGNFRHAPNYHGAKILREQCWPKIHSKLKSKHPAITCHVYGAYMSPKAKQLENKKLGFLMHGYAKNQFDVINKARVMLAPISFGAGVKGKLLDAMQCSTPSVTTPIGYEGISQLPWPGTVVLSIDDFVEAAVALYTNVEKWNDASKKAKTLLQSDYNTNKNNEKFAQCLIEKFSTFAHDREINFAQKLLGHHQFQTSKYMSQWIEAKNR